jgi:mRNA-degrading endonuclease RelE of RelBE toxin-antitoxin system
MDFRIADTFTDSLGKLTNEEQKAVKTTAFDLQIDPANPGMKFHRVDKAKDKNFWSVRVNRDVRLIVHRSSDSLVLCYVDHHDKAYSWAERRRLEAHPKTGAAQLVEIRERVEEVVVPVYVEEPAAAPDEVKPEAPPVLASVPDDELLAYGVPLEWIADVKRATEDTILEIADHLPAEAAEAMLELATGGKPVVRLPDVKPEDPFEHPDAQRRFRLMTDVEELERALEYPWEKWTIFLHPNQQTAVERDYGGPARVSGSAGTGKTIVALHRAAHLARSNEDARVLLTTFSDTLASGLRTRLRRLLHGEPRLGERIDVYSIGAIGRRLHERLIGPAPLAGEDVVRELIAEASEAVGGHRFTHHFLYTEWNQVVDAWQLDDWEAYRDVARLGRKTRLPEAQREILWQVFERVRNGLRERQLVTEPQMFAAVTSAIRLLDHPPFDFAVVDESQDFGVAHLRFLAALGEDRPNALFFAGDLGQRIFQQPFSWKTLGVDIRGRSSTLRVNYRTSHQIRMQADRLLGPSESDVDGYVEDRRHTVSVFNGPPPVSESFETPSQESEGVGAWLRARSENGMLPHEFGVFVRASDQLDRATAAVEAAGLPYRLLDEGIEPASGHVSISTMDLAKGLEFRAVAVMACDDEVIPLQKRIEEVGDEADLQDVYETERHLLYVACTRARDELLITCVAPGSEFLDDMRV